MKEIYLIRHGQTDYNKLGIVQGSGVDTSLNEVGQQQAQAFFNFYQHIPFEVVLTSALKRTHETVQPFVKKPINWHQHPEINEMSWGIHEGKHRTDAMKAEYQLVTDEWAKGNFDARLSSGESANDVHERCLVFKEHLLNRTESKILICAHGRLNRVLVCTLLNQGLEHMESYGHINTGLYRFELKEDQFKLLLANDAKHLERIPESIY